MAKKNLYFLAIIPEEGLRKEIHEIKLLAAEQYHSQAALKSPPHITLHMPFQWREDREQLLIEAISRFDFKAFPIDVRLKDFDFFPPRVVFIHVDENESLRQLQKQLSDHVRRELNIFNDTYKDLGFHPHITIAFRDLKKSLFPQVMDEFSKRKFVGVMNVTGFTLLKNINKKWERLAEF